VLGANVRCGGQSFVSEDPVKVHCAKPMVGTIVVTVDDVVVDDVLVDDVVAMDVVVE